MSEAMLVLATAGAFVGTHFLLSHSLRAPLVRAVGEQGFRHASASRSHSPER